MFSLQKEKPAIRNTLYILMALVLIVSVATVLFYGDRFLLGTYAKLNNDDVGYMYAAKVLLEEGTLVYKSYPDPTLFIMPGLPIILAFFMLIFGDYETTAAAFRLFQCVLQTAMIYFLFVIGRHLFNSKVALAACIIAAIYLPNYYTSGVILSESIFQFLFFLIICMTLWALNKPSTGRYIVIGILIALACYFKPQIVLFPLIIGITWLTRKYSWKKMILYTITIVMTVCVVMSPWWVRNYVDFGKFIPFTTSSGNPMLMGILPGGIPAEFYNKYPEYSPDVYDDSTETVGKIIGFNFETRPFESFKWYAFDKVLLSFEHDFYWMDLWGITQEPARVGHVILTLLGAAGLLLVWFRRKHDFTVLTLTLLYFIGVHIPFVAFSRYMYPIMFILTLTGAYLLVYLFELGSNLTSSRSKKSTGTGMKLGG
ncbi:glycosyltransferase family 39 protein [Paenibacillus sp. FJAT-26967]|uniref:ArnT family glycosyltransferase n=1 Tax=Paenibacillus sp. FJAT-26967 TaxID=1729690 RepID=UPI000837E09C|nr:glycosyltransferase family 39 protein [Paenibacillus sp. FJAT-26967]